MAPAFSQLEEKFIAAKIPRGYDNLARRRSHEHICGGRETALTVSGSQWERAQRLDSAAMARAVRASTGIALTVTGPCAGGQVGAAFVRWPDGHLAVLKWQPGVSLADLETGPLAVVDAVRAAGYPAPAIELAIQAGQAIVTVQELLPGEPLDHLGEGTLAQALALNQSQAGLLAGQPGVPPMKLYLTSDGGGYCLHRPAAEYSRATAALERWVRTVGAEYPDDLPGDDAIHGDFHPGNVLAANGTITGVIDWDGAARGHRGFDLVTLRFCWQAPAPAPAPSDPAALARLDAELDALPAQVLRPAWAHLSLRLVDWAIRHFGPAEIDYWLEVAQLRMS
jgi:hypothetical protein